MRASELAEKVKLLVLDVDGVLTDGGLYYDHQGNVSKRFNVQDGFGIKAAQSAGLDVAVITGLNHVAVESRVRELGIEDYYAGNYEKVPLIEDLRSKKGLEFSEIAYLGDDWVDAGVMKRVGLPMAVANAQPEILDIAAWTADKRGGHGAVREAIAFILHSQGKLEDIWRRWAE